MLSNNHQEIYKRTYALEKQFLLKLNLSKCRKGLHLYETKICYRDYAYIYFCEVFQ